MGADTYSLSTGDYLLISPNQRYKINNTGNARVDVILLNLSNPASLTQEFIPQSLIRGLVTGLNCTHFAKVTRGDYRYNNLIDDMNTVISAENEKHESSRFLFTAKCTTFSIFFFHRVLLRFVMLRLRAKSTVLSAELRNISTTTSATALLLIQ